jgi:uncharacterized membrane protein
MNAMTLSSRISAFIAYLLLIVGWLFVLIFRRNDDFARFHARQSLALTVTVIIIPLAWAAFAWVITWIPYVGFILAASTFALVIALAIIWVVVWIVGMANALRGVQKPVPIFGSRMK